MQLLRQDLRPRGEISLALSRLRSKLLLPINYRAEAARRSGLLADTDRDVITTTVVIFRGLPLIKV